MDACPMALDPRHYVSPDMKICMGFPVVENQFARLSVDNPILVWVPLVQWNRCFLLYLLVTLLCRFLGVFLLHR